MSKDTAINSSKANDKTLETNEILSRIECAVKAQNHLMASELGFIEDKEVIKLPILFNALWEKKFLVTFITIAFAVLSIIYSLSIPNIYRATTVLAPTNNESKGSLGGLASQYGGLAAMAGINLGGLDSDKKIEQAIVLLNSWPYLDEFIEKYNLKPTFMATKGWDEVANELIYDETLYNVESGEWLVENGKSMEPKSFETFEKVKSLISIDIDTKSGLVDLSVSHYSPFIAKSIVKLLTKELNEYFKEKDQKQAKKSINALSNKISETDNSDMQQLFYKMIEGHSKTLLMTEVSDEYLIKTLVPTMLPEEKSSPRRALIVLLGTLLGGSFAVCFVLFRAFKNQD